MSTGNRVRITQIIGGRPGRDKVALSGTVIVHASVHPARRSGELVVLSASSDFDRRLVVRASRSGNVSFVVDTAQLLNGPCDITVRDLHGHEAIRHVCIDNPLSKTGHFYYRDESRPVPQIPRAAGNTPFHSHEYYSFFPIIGLGIDTFQINFYAPQPNVFPLEIRNTQGNLVQRLSVKADPSDQTGAGQSQPHYYASIQWDGKDNVGRAVPPGDYELRAMLPNQPGPHKALGIIHREATQKPAKSQEVTNTNGLQFVGLKEGATLAGDVLVQVSPAGIRTTPGHVLLLLDGELVGASMPVIRQRTACLTLSTTRFANGKHTLEARDFQGNSKRQSVVFQNPVSQIRYEPDFDVNTGGNGPRLSHFTATLPRACPWKVTIRNEKGQPMKSFRGQSKTILLGWDGSDDRGKRAPYGDYAILLQVVDSSVSDTTLGFISLYASEE